ncbi:MAG: hypothetical protein MH186_10710 [Marinobacter sp.]|nr:hypothetical protein [Marinobacter sp.]
MYALFFLGFVQAGLLPKQWKQKENWVIILVSVTAIVSAFYGATTVLVYLFAMSDRVAKLSEYIPWGFRKYTLLEPYRDLVAATVTPLRY